MAGAVADTPKGRLRQQSIFAFTGFEKRALANGTPVRVMPSGDEEYKAKYPNACRYDGCDDRFARPCGRATHEKTCKWGRMVPLRIPAHPSALAVAIPALAPRWP